MGVDTPMMPVLDGHPDVFDRRWPLRVADIDAGGRLRLDAAARHIQDIGQDQASDWGADEKHPLWVVRRTTIDVIRPIEFPDTLRLRRWCSGTSTRWCRMRVRIDGGRGGLIESEAFWININRNTQMPGLIDDAFLERAGRTTDIRRLRWKPYLTPQPRDTATRISHFPVRFTDIDLFDHMNNAVYWSAVEEHLSSRPGRRDGPLRVTIEHLAPVARHDTLEIYEHHRPHPHPGTVSGDRQTQRTATTILTYAVGAQAKAVAALTGVPAMS
jgi:acyl-ACP thioesterase